MPTVSISVEWQKTSSHELRTYHTECNISGSKPMQVIFMASRVRWRLAQNTASVEGGTKMALGGARRWERPNVQHNFHVCFSPLLSGVEGPSMLVSPV